MLDFLKPKKRLVIVGDDFGLSRSVNKGILYSTQKGILKEISVMIYGPHIEHALRLVQENNLKNLGLHITLQGLNSNKKLLKIEDYVKIFQNYSKKQIIKAAKEELSLFEKQVGFIPTHLAPHQGIHGNLKLLEFLIEYAKQHSIPIRIPRTPLDGGIESQNYSAEILLKRNDVKTTDYLFGEILGGDIQKIQNNYLKKLEKVKPDESAELLFHPGFFDKDLMQHTSLTYERGRDIALLTDRTFIQKLKALNFKIINYSQL